MYIRRSEDAQVVFWRSYVRSIYVLCLGRSNNGCPNLEHQHYSDILKQIRKDQTKQTFPYSMFPQVKFHSGCCPKYIQPIGQIATFLKRIQPRENTQLWYHIIIFYTGGNYFQQSWSLKTPTTIPVIMIILSTTSAKSCEEDCNYTSK